MKTARNGMPYLQLGELWYLKQNPETGSVWAQAARCGCEIFWELYQEPCEDGSVAYTGNVLVNGKLLSKANAHSLVTNSLSQQNPQGREVNEMAEQTVQTERPSLTEDPGVVGFAQKRQSRNGNGEYYRLSLKDGTIAVGFMTSKGDIVFKKSNSQDGNFFEWAARANNAQSK